MQPIRPIEQFVMLVGMSNHVYFYNILNIQWIVVLKVEVCKC